MTVLLRNIVDVGLKFGYTTMNLKQNIFETVGSKKYVISIIRGRQSANRNTKRTSAIEEVALRFNVLFWDGSSITNITEVVLQTKVFKICCAFNFFFPQITQFYTLNLILFHFDRNIDKRRPSFLVFLCLKSQKMRYLHYVVKFQLRKLGPPLPQIKYHQF